MVVPNVPKFVFMLLTKQSSIETTFVSNVSFCRNY